MVNPLLLLVASAVFRGDLPARPVPSTFPVQPRAALLSRDTTARLVALQRDADRRLATGDVNGALTAFREIVAHEDSSRLFPGRTLWALATIEYGRGRDLRAAELLDEVAESAARYGRPDWQARALLEAGLIYQQHARTDLSVARYRQLLPLLTSPAISENERAALKARVVMR